MTTSVRTIDYHSIKTDSRTIKYLCLREKERVYKFNGLLRIKEWLLKKIIFSFAHKREFDDSYYQLHEAIERFSTIH